MEIDQMVNLVKLLNADEISRETMVEIIEKITGKWVFVSDADDRYMLRDSFEELFQALNEARFDVMFDKLDGDYLYDQPGRFLPHIPEEYKQYLHDQRGKYLYEFINDEDAYRHHVRVVLSRELMMSNIVLSGRTRDLVIERVIQERKWDFGKWLLKK